MVDGREALRRALDAPRHRAMPERVPKVIVSAWAVGNGLVFGQRKVNEKSNGGWYKQRRTAVFR